MYKNICELIKQKRDVCELIKQKRIMKGLKQKELADMIGVSSSEMCKIENGTRIFPNIEILIKLKIALDISNEELSEMYGLSFDTLLNEDAIFLRKIYSVFLKEEIDSILTLNRFEIMNLKEYVKLLLSKDKKEEKEAISILIKSIQNS